MHISKHIISLSFILIIFLVSCYEKQDGCLDIVATNFSFGADLDCDGCCVYPKLQIVFDHKVDTFNFSYSSYYTLDFDQVIQFQYVGYYLSKIALKTVDEVQVSIEEKVQIIDYDNNEKVDSIIDNIIWVELPDFRYDIGTFRHINLFTALEYTFGMEDRVALSEDDEDHPLGLAKNLFLEDDKAYVNMRLIIMTDTLTKQIDTFQIEGVAQAIPIEIPIDTSFQGGIDFQINIKADYFKWIQGVNFKQDSEEKIIETIKSNTKNVFSVL